MAASGGSCSVPSFPPPRPKSPPEYPDLYGKRRGLAKVQVLEREIGCLEDELKFVQGLQSASRSCKEVTDFVVANSDPLIPANRKIRRSRRFWKWLCGSSCFDMSWICCCECTPHVKIPHCCDCNLHHCLSCFSCLRPKCRCCSCPRPHCFDEISCCSSNCCVPQCPSCPSCSCSCSCRWKCSWPKCPKVNLCCSSCTKDCCHQCI